MFYILEVSVLNGTMSINCVCKGVTMAEIKEAIVRDKLVSLENVAASCRGAGTKCGLCQPYIQTEINNLTNVNSSTK